MKCLTPRKPSINVFQIVLEFPVPTDLLDSRVEMEGLRDSVLRIRGGTKVMCQSQPVTDYVTR